VAGRALAFADPEIIRLATKEFIPVTCDDWYQRRRRDAEGDFFRAVANQGPRKGLNESTRQGIYCLTADGTLLAYKNAGQNPQVMREVLRQALAAWQKLPESRRKPGAVRVAPPDAEDEQYVRRPPPQGLILKVWTRALDRSPSGDLLPAACDPGRGGEAARDHAWFTAEEARTLLPPEVKVGTQYPLPRKLALRLARFHLVDNTRGEPPAWEPEELRSCDLVLHVEEVTAEKIRLSLQGDVLLATSAFLWEAKRGYRAQMHGTLLYDRRHARWESIRLTALGQHWGEGLHTQGARPGKNWLGVALELSLGDKPMDRIPPQGARDRRDYFGR
jgi:hypothetical protein